MVPSDSRRRMPITKAKKLLTRFYTSFSQAENLARNNWFSPWLVVEVGIAMSLYRNMSVCRFCRHFRKNASFFKNFLNSPGFRKWKRKFISVASLDFRFFCGVDPWTSFDHNSLNIGRMRLRFRPMMENDLSFLDFDSALFEHYWRSYDHFSVYKGNPVK